MTARFTAPLILEKTGYEEWTVYKGFAFIDSAGNRWPVPKDTKSNLGSIPWIAQFVVPKVSAYDQAMVLHDLHYNRHCLGLDTRLSRLQADQILREGCHTLSDNFGLPLSQRRTTAIDRGVRGFGVEAWESPGERRDRLDKLSLPDEVIE